MKFSLSFVASLYFLLSTIQVSNLITRPCVVSITQIINCSAKIPENCQQWSQLTTCAENVLYNLQICPDGVALKIVKHLGAMYKISHRFFCDVCNPNVLMKNRECLAAVNATIPFWTMLTPGFLSVKGCKFFQTFLTMISEIRRLPTCFDIIYDYSQIACGTLGVKIYNTPANIILKSVFEKIKACSILFNNISQCGLKKSEYQLCIEQETLDKIDNQNSKSVEDNIILIAKATENFICSHRKETLSNRDCLKDLNSLFQDLAILTNGYLTKEGCEGLAYVGVIWLRKISEMSCPVLLQEYWVTMRQNLTCYDVYEDDCFGFSIYTL